MTFRWLGVTRHSVKKGVQQNGLKRGLLTPSATQKTKISISEEVKWKS